MNITTILSSQIQEPEIDFFNLFAILSSGILVGCTMFEYILYRLRIKSHSVDDDADDADNHNIEDDEKYTDRYYDEFNALPLRVLTEEELTNLQTNIVCESVANNVKVIMTFDKSTNTFWYYTDQLKEVSYHILETVARKFMIDYDCKIIQAAQYPIEQAKPASSNATASSTVFAQFKKYNTGCKGSSPNFNSANTKVVGESMNHYRYRGKIRDYETTTTQKIAEKKKEEALNLDYAAYKILYCKNK